MEEIYLFITLDLIKDLKNLKKTTQLNQNQQPAIGVSSSCASAGGSLSPGSWRKEALIAGDDPCCPVESCMIYDVIPIFLAGK